jgi:thymidylate synthase (FAD)
LANPFLWRETLSVNKVWITPDGDNLVGYMARVSNPNATEDDPADRLIRYLIRHEHWSPFEMVHACVEINTTRDISRQILRHRSFSFQEFSGRYAEYGELTSPREARLQDTKNRQNSLPADEELRTWFDKIQRDIAAHSWLAYKDALARGVAKEQARVLLPEGLVPTRMYMSGSLRSWIHYWRVRCTAATQKEHRLVAEETRSVVLSEYPNIKSAIENWEPPADG